MAEEGVSGEIARPTRILCFLIKVMTSCGLSGVLRERLQSTKIPSD